MLEMTATELRDHMQHSATSPFILDVREPWEYRIARLDDSTNIPMSEIVARAPSLDAQRETIVVCHHGVRSRAVANLLERAGFRSVINLRGGIDAWARELDPDMALY